jgi:hypothetical protein
MSAERSFSNMRPDVPFAGYISDVPITDVRACLTTPSDAYMRAA